MEGKILLESEEGRGSKFSIIFHNKKFQNTVKKTEEHTEELKTMLIKILEK